MKRIFGQFEFNVSRNNISMLAFLFAFILFTGLSVKGQTVITESTPGSYNYTIPQWVTLLSVEAWGAGGGGATTRGIDNTLDGGGGGAFASSILIVTPKAVYTYDVGAGGAIGADGGSSNFAATLVLAEGGETHRFEGLASNSIGQIKFDGGRGYSGHLPGPDAYFGGGGGAGATPIADGGSALGINAGTNPGNIGNGGNGGNGDNVNGVNGTFPGGAGGGGAGPDETSVSGTGADGQIILRHTSLEILSALCECNNDQTPDNTDGTFSTVLIIKTNDDSPLEPNLSFPLISSTGLTDDFGQSLNGTSFSYCDGISCPPGVAIGQYYMEVNVQQSGAYTASIDTDEDTVGDLDLNTSCGAVVYPALPAFPVELTAIICLDGTLNLSAVSNAVFAIDNSPFNIELPDQFTQDEDIVSPEGNTSGPNVLTITPDIVEADNDPVFELHLIRQEDGCRVSRYKEFNVYNPVDATLDPIQFTCRTPREDDFFFLNYLLSDANTGGGVFEVDGIEYEDGKFPLDYDVSNPVTVCEEATYTITDECGVEHTATASFQITFKPTPSFDFDDADGVPTSPHCASDEIDIEVFRTSSGPNPEFIVTADPDTGPDASVNGSIITLPNPEAGDIIVYTICLVETTDVPAPDPDCPGLPALETCSDTICRDFILYQDELDCGANNPFPNECRDYVLEVCGTETIPGIKFGCLFLSFESPPVLSADIDMETPLVNCSDSEITGSSNVFFFGLSTDDAPGGGVKLGDLPGISVVCDVLNFKVLGWRPLGAIYDLLGCDKTLLQIIFDLLSKIAGGDGGGFITMADTDGDGGFDYLVEEGSFPAEFDFVVPNNVYGLGNVTIRTVAGWVNSPSGVCGNFDITKINLIEILPIGAIPVVGAIIEDILAAAGCNINLSMSVEKTVIVPVIDNIPAKFLNCNENGYIFAQTLDCEIPVNWSVPAASSNCSTEPLTYIGVTEFVDLDYYAGQSTITPVELDQPGIYQTLGPVPGSILPPGEYAIQYTAASCNGYPEVCEFTVTVTAGDPILECPDEIVFSTGIDECDAAVNGLALYQGMGCASIINYSYVNPVSGSPVSTNSTTIGTHNVPDGNLFEVGTTEVTYTMLVDIDGDGDYDGIDGEDENRETQVCSFNVIVEDNQLPDAKCVDVEIQLDNTGAGTVYAEEFADEVYIDGGSTDNCSGDLTILLSEDNENYFPSLDFDCEDIGPNIVSLQVTDANGNSSYCKATIKVIDFFEGFVLDLDVPEVCFEPFQNSFDFSPYLVIAQPNGQNIFHENVGTLGPEVVGAFGISAFLPDPGSTDDPGSMTLDGVYTLGTGTGYITISYILSITEQVNQISETDFLTGCFQMVHDVFRVEKLDPIWEGGYMCCDQLPVWLGGAAWDGTGEPPIPAGMLSLTDIRGSYPGDVIGEWTGDGVSFVDPDGTPYSGDEFFMFDPQGFDGTYTLTYTIGDEPCIFDYSQDILVTCQDLHVEISDMLVCPANWVPEQEVLVNLDDGDLVVSTTGFDVIGAAGGHYGAGPDTDPVVDLVDVPVIDGRVVIPGFFAPAVRDELYEICVTAYQTTPFGCSDIFCYFIRVQDLEAPEFSNCPKEPIVVDAPSGWCQSFVNFEYPWVNDNCMGLDVEVIQVDTSGLVSGDLFPVGLTVLAYTATDTVGNQSYCELKIIVDDYDRAPEIACPSNRQQVNDPDECGAVVYNIAPTSYTDNCPDNLSIVYESVDEENEIIACGLEDASGDFFPVGDNTVTYTIYDQPLLLITEVVQDGNIAGVEITNFGPASMDITCGSFKIKMPDGTLLEEYMVPTPNNKSQLTMTPIYPPDPVVWENPTPNLIPVGGTFVHVFDQIPPEGQELIYCFDFLERSIDAAVINGEVEGEVILRKSVCDHDLESDFIPATPCDPGSFDMLNPGLPVMTDNGTKTALQNYDPSQDQCSFTVSVVDLEDPTCIKHDSITVANQSVPHNIEPLECVTSEIMMPPGLVYDVNIHDFVLNIADAGVVTAFLNSPEGTEILLFDDVCDGEADIDVDLDNTIVWTPAPLIEDALCNPLGQGNIYSPEESFKAFYGEEGGGIWTLEIYTTGEISGVLTNWDLEILYQLPYDQGDVVLDNIPGICEAEFTWIHPVFEDNCCEGTVEVHYIFVNEVTGEEDLDVEVILNGTGTINLQGLEETRIFPVGVTTVEYVLVDQYGNTSYCGFTVTVEDNEDPVFITTCPDRIINLYPTECYGELTDPPQAIDNCELEGIIYYYEDGSVADIRNLPIGVWIITAVATDIYGNFISCTFTVEVLEFIPQNGSLVCNNEVNLSLDQHCEAIITADMILEGDLYRCYENYCIEVIDSDGNVHANYFDYSDVGQTFTVTVSDCGGTGNFCSTIFTITEKFVPEILCPDDAVVACNADISPEVLGVVEILNCEPFAIIDYEDEYIDYEVCDNPRAEVIRTWTVDDQQGNIVSCEQRILIERFDLDQVSFPDNVYSTECVLFNEDDEASHPDNTGYPAIDGVAINQNLGYCMLSYLWTDEVYQYCGSSFEILRTWKVRDMCGEVSADNPLTHIQTIKVFDEEAPIFHDCVDLVVNTTSFDCDADVYIPVPMITDNCNEISLEVFVAGAAVQVQGNFADGTMIMYVENLGLGIHAGRFIARDECGNKEICLFSIEVVDEYVPIAECEQYKQASLTPDGTASVYAEDFNSGSFDNCGPVWFKVLRGHELDNYNQILYDGGCPDLNGDDNPFTTAVESWFDDQVYFCCEDLGLEHPDGIMVTLRVFDVDPGPGPIDPQRMYSPGGDLYDTYNDCWSIVDIECKIPPVVDAPDLEVGCETILDPVENFLLWPDVSSVCDYEISFEDSDKNGDVCSGYIDRVWTVIGCGMTVTKLQRIFISSEIAFDPCTIEFPADESDIICPDNTGDPGYPTWDEHPCNIVTAEIVNIDTFTFVDDACYKIVVDWAVIDWCVYEQNAGAEDNVDETNNRQLICDGLVEDGYYRYTQILMVKDIYAPEILVEDQCIATTSGCYAAGVELEAFATDSCNVDEKFWWKYIAINMDSWDTVQYSYNYTPEPDQGVKQSRSKDKLDNRADAKMVFRNPLAIGSYRIEWTVGDGCGNASSTYQYFEVRDKKAPTPFLVDISTALMTNGMVEMTARFFDKGACNGECLASFDNCSDDIYFTFTDILPVITHPDWIDPFGLYYFDPSTGEQMNASSGRNSYLSGVAHSWNPVTRTSGKVFVCDDAPAVNVDVYVWDQFALNGDCDDGNFDFGTVLLQINVLGDDCGDEILAVVSGSTFNRNTGEKVPGVEVTLMQDNPEYPIYAESDGDFAFNHVAFGNYELKADKYNEHANGVSTLDLVVIQRHLLGIKAMDDVYNIIASDANESGSISAADILDLRKLILAVTDKLPKGRSWRFIDANYEFENTVQPWVEMADAEMIDMLLDQNRSDIDFIGIKLGDVNASLNLIQGNNSIDNRHLDKFELFTDDIHYLKDELIEVPVYGKSDKELFGMQFTMQSGDLEIMDIKSGSLIISTQNIALHQANQMTFSWNSSNGKELNEEEVLFYLKLKATKNGVLAESLDLNSSITVAEAYLSPALVTHSIDLKLNGRSEIAFELLQNVPNPFTEQTVIEFIMPGNGSYELIIHDVSGKVLKVIDGEGSKGINSILVEERTLPPGILYYKLKTDDHTDSKKMLLIK